jgi:hypothetical protein
MLEAMRRPDGIPVEQAAAPAAAIDDASSGEAGPTELGASIVNLARRYQHDPAIDFIQASPMQVLAWCIAQAETAAVPPAADLLQKQREQQE